MRYYVSAEGGGSKLIAILYDENLNVINYAKSGGVNELFKNYDEVVLEVKNLFATLIPSYVTEIERLVFSSAGGHKTILKVLSEKLKIKEIITLTEGKIALYANGYEYGILAQSGTGSDAFLVQPNGELIIGGWGAYIGDEGSGFDIGARAVRSAIWAEEGRGEQTVILDILKKQFNTNNLKNNLGEVATKYSTRENIASATKIAGEAARLGDKVAVDIFKYAGEAMAKQTFAGINKIGGKWAGPIIASGGAWKASPVFFETYKNLVLEKYPNATVKLAKFEPVVGGVTAQRFNDFKSHDELLLTLENKFSDFIIKY